MGMALLPLNILFILFSPLESGLLLISASMIIGGAWGLYSLFKLTQYAISTETGQLEPPTQWLGIKAGILTCFAGIYYSSGLMFIVFLGPIIATAHLVYLYKYSD